MDAPPGDFIEGGVLLSVCFQGRSDSLCIYAWCAILSLVATGETVVVLSMNVNLFHLGGPSSRVLVLQARVWRSFAVQTEFLRTRTRTRTPAVNVRACLRDIRVIARFGPLSAFSVCSSKDFHAPCHIVPLALFEGSAQLAQPYIGTRHFPIRQYLVAILYVAPLPYLIDYHVSDC